MGHGSCGEDDDVGRRMQGGIHAQVAPGPAERRHRPASASGCTTQFPPRSPAADRGCRGCSRCSARTSTVAANSPPVPSSGAVRMPPEWQAGHCTHRTHARASRAGRSPRRSCAVGVRTWQPCSWGARHPACARAVRAAHRCEPQHSYAAQRPASSNGALQGVLQARLGGSGHRANGLPHWCTDATASRVKTHDNVRLQQSD